jgi:hypothetical protein
MALRLLEEVGWVGESKEVIEKRTRKVVSMSRCGSVVACSTATCMGAGICRQRQRQRDGGKGIHDSRAKEIRL